MKIAFFTDTFVPQINGVASSVANSAKELGLRGHQVLIFAPKVDGIKRKGFKAKNVKVISLPSLPGEVYPEYKLSLFGYSKALKNLKVFNPDIIHLHTPLTVGFNALLLAKTLKKPLVGTIHYFFINPNYLEWVNNQLAIRIVRKFNTIAYKYSCFFYGICTLRTSPSKNLIKEIAKSGYKKQIKYVPNGINLENFPKLSDHGKELIKKKYQLKQKVVLHFGRISGEKNVDLVIKSFSKIATSYPNVSLLIIGDGPSKASLESLVSKLALEDSVKFTGIIAHEKLISSGLLQVADVFVTASDMETQPMCVLEAMANGLPIVAVREAGLVELVSNNGYLVRTGDINELAEKTKQILYNPELAKKMSENSIRMVQEFSIQNTTSRLIQIYHKVIKAKKEISSKIKIQDQAKELFNGFERWLS